MNLSVTNICDHYLFRTPMGIVAAASLTYQGVERSAIPGDTIQIYHLLDVARRNRMIATPEPLKWRLFRGIAVECGW
jgi:hypothetical protein